MVYGKEQRVDGSWCRVKYNSLHLRYTLMGFERNYQIKIPSKQLNIKKFSTSNYSNHVNPWFWTGFIDAEGCFNIPAGPRTVGAGRSINKLNWRVQSKFEIALHIPAGPRTVGAGRRDKNLLLQLQQFFGWIGSIREYPTINIICYVIDSNKDLIKLIIRFENYPLLTQKAADFILFKEVIKLINNKAHLSIEGLHQIINLKASINLDISDLLKSEFKDITPVERSVINTKNIPDPNWIAGFI